jgi:hypothetical protein
MTNLRKVIVLICSRAATSYQPEEEPSEGPDSMPHRRGLAGRIDEHCWSRLFQRSLIVVQSLISCNAW